MSGNQFPTEVWSHVSQYCSSKDIVLAVSLLSREIHGLFEKTNDTFWISLLLRDGFEYNINNTPYEQYSLAFCPTQPLKRIEQCTTSDIAYKVLLINNEVLMLSTRVMEWLVVSF
jgi:hypothetical protein